MSSYYLAPSLSVLWAEVKVLDPGRDRASDGWIGDAAHAARPSDHNPAPPTGVIRALDLDDDFTSEAHKRLVVAELIADPRTAYVITDGRIWTRSSGEWSDYHGADNHFSHIHLSILHTLAAEKDTRPWLSPAARAQEDDMTPAQAKLLETTAAKVDKLYTLLSGIGSLTETKRGRRVKHGAGYYLATIARDVAAVKRKTGS